MKKILSIIFLISILSFSAMATDWVSWQSNDGYTPDSLPATNNSLFAVQLNTTGATNALYQPLVVGGTTVYVASANGTVFARNAITGVAIAQSGDLNGTAGGLAAGLAYDGSFVYAASGNGTVWKLNPTTLVTVLQSPSLGAGGIPPLISTLAIDATNNLLYVPSWGVGVATNMTTLNTATMLVAGSTTALGTNPEQIILNSTHVVWANANGTVNCTTLNFAAITWGSMDLGASQWITQTGNFVYAADETANNNVTQLNYATGAETASGANWVGGVGAVSIATDGTRVYVGLNNGSVAAYSTTAVGSTLPTSWISLDLGAAAVYVTVSGNFVYATSNVGGADGNITALTPADGTVAWTSESTFIGNVTDMGLVGDSGIAYVSSDDGYLRAFADQSTVAVTVPVPYLANQVVYEYLIYPAATFSGGAGLTDTRTYQILDANGVSQMAGIWGGGTWSPDGSIDVSGLDSGAYTFIGGITNRVLLAATSSIIFQVEHSPPRVPSMIKPKQETTEGPSTGDETQIDEEGADAEAGEGADGTTAGTAAGDTTWLWWVVGILAIVVIAGYFFIVKK